MIDFELSSVNIREPGKTLIPNSSIKMRRARVPFVKHLWVIGPVVTRRKVPPQGHEGVRFAGSLRVASWPWWFAVCTCACEGWYRGANAEKMTCPRVSGEKSIRVRGYSSAGRARRSQRRGRRFDPD